MWRGRILIFIFGDLLYYLHVCEGFFAGIVFLDREQPSNPPGRHSLASQSLQSRLGLREKVNFVYEGKS